MRQELAIILIFGLPIITVIAAAWVLAIQTRCKYKLNSEIISSGIDRDTARLLLCNPKRKPLFNFDTLRIALLLIFMGTSALISEAMELSKFALVFVMALGGGLGLLLSFIIEWKLSKKIAEKSAECDSNAKGE